MIFTTDFDSNFPSFKNACLPKLCDNREEFVFSSLVHFLKSAGSDYWGWEAIFVHLHLLLLLTNPSFLPFLLLIEYADRQKGSGWRSRRCLSYITITWVQESGILSLIRKFLLEERKTESFHFIPKPLHNPFPSFLSENRTFLFNYYHFIFKCHEPPVKSPDSCFVFLSLTFSISIHPLCRPSSFLPCQSSPICQRLEKGVINHLWNIIHQGQIFTGFSQPFQPKLSFQKLLVHCTLHCCIEIQKGTICTRRIFGCFSALPSFVFFYDVIFLQICQGHKGRRK